MALIKCPNCGEEVSEKAEKCIHCGADILRPEPEPEIIRCEDCGEILSETDTICPKCGCPVVKNEEPGEEEKPQKVEVTNVKISVNKDIRKTLIIIIIAILAAAAAFLAIRSSNEKKASKEYADKINTAAVAMHEGSMIAESSASLIHDVWFNSIYEKDSSRTDKYTKDARGEFYDDFDTAIFMLMFDDSFNEDIEQIKTSQESVQNLMKELKNPPEEHADAYDALKEFYDSYLELTDLALNPTGNLTSYTSSLNDADTRVYNCYKAMQLYLEE
ncbi:MAG: zinc ribbon domain-containing protein [Eubacteriales bacterium]|nr:zinc ribbon domain-containing protein [Eubacteriales bacterium]